jgi:hypothetical protein
VVALVLHASLRGGEVCALDLDDVELGEPSGKVLVRSGEREKYRGVPLT